MKILQRSNEVLKQLVKSSNQTYDCISNIVIMIIMIVIVIATPTNKNNSNSNYSNNDDNDDTFFLTATC